MRRSKMKFRTIQRRDEAWQSALCEHYVACCDDKTQFFRRLGVNICKMLFLIQARPSNICMSFGVTSRKIPLGPFVSRYRSSVSVAATLVPYSLWGRRSVVPGIPSVDTHTHTHARTHAGTHAPTHPRTHARTHVCIPFFFHPSLDLMSVRSRARPRARAFERRDVFAARSDQFVLHVLHARTVVVCSDYQSKS